MVLRTLAGGTARECGVSVLSPGQVWQAADGKQRTILAMHPQTLTADAWVRVRTGSDQTTVISMRTLRAWISKQKAAEVVPCPD